MSLADAADELSVSIDTVRRLIAAGRIDAFRIGQQLRISEDALDAYLDAAALPTRGTSTATRRRT